MLESVNNKTTSASKNKRRCRIIWPKRAALFSAVAVFLLSGCADSVSPKSRNVSIPSLKAAEERSKGLNENGDSVIYLPLGDDVLMPQTEKSEPLPSTIVGPFELRGETLAGALQLVLDGTNIPVAFEADASLSKTITMTNLRGPLDTVVQEICSLGNMYCSYQNGILVVKETQVFTVAIPPIVAADSMAGLLTNISNAIGSITGAAPITDPSTRTIVYRASQRTSELAERYFQRLRSSTALVVFETYIWEVSLDSGNSTGIRWSMLDSDNGFNYGIKIAGAAATSLGTPISIGLPTTGKVDFSVGDVFQFISTYGAVKTVSQPQITVLSGSTAKLRVADTQNYVASLSRTVTDGGTTTVSTTTDSVDSGFTLNIGSNWDNSTVYGNIDILLQQVRGIDTFDDNPDAVVQLPQTTERELSTQVRIRPGDLLLIAGLVRETDNLDKSGLGISGPSLPFSRAAKSSNSELVFLLRPRVVVFTPGGEHNPITTPYSTTYQNSFYNPSMVTMAPLDMEEAPAPVSAASTVSASAANSQLSAQTVNQAIADARQQNTRMSSGSSAAQNRTRTDMMPAEPTVITPPEVSQSDSTSRKPISLNNIPIYDAPDYHAPTYSEKASPDQNDKSAVEVAPIAQDHPAIEISIPDTLPNYEHTIARTPYNH